MTKNKFIRPTELLTKNSFKYNVAKCRLFTNGLYKLWQREQSKALCSVNRFDSFDNFPKFLLKWTSENVKITGTFCFR